MSWNIIEIFPMTQKNKIIKVIGSDNCKECALLLNLIEDYITQKELDIAIVKISSVSDEAIDIAINFDINTIPFAIFNNKKIVFDKTTCPSDLKDLFK